MFVLTAHREAAGDESPTQPAGPERAAEAAVPPPNLPTRGVHPPEPPPDGSRVPDPDSLEHETVVPDPDRLDAARSGRPAAPGAGERPSQRP
jgi:hypothetical protein